MERLPQDGIIRVDKYELLSLRFQFCGNVGIFRIKKGMAFRCEQLQGKVATYCISNMYRRLFYSDFALPALTHLSQYRRDKTTCLS